MIIEIDIVVLVCCIEMLEVEVDICCIQVCYMFFCDMLNLEFGVVDDVECIELIMQFYMEDVVWEGVGEYYDNQFGCVVGVDVICKYFQGFWGGKIDFVLILNCYYLMLEQIYVYVNGMMVDGQWVYMQLWFFFDGKVFFCFLCFNNMFCKEFDGVWKIICICIENVFVVLLFVIWVLDYLLKLVLMKF